MVPRATIRSRVRSRRRYRYPVRIRRDPIERSAVEHARVLRRRPAAGERTAWRILRNRQMFGLRFRRQHPIDGFVVDFYCAELRLVLEIDGAVHEKTAKASYDKARTSHLEARGLQVVRLQSRDVSESRLKELLQRLRTNRSPSPHRGEGARG